jgi:hypothetical protein
MTSIVLVEYKSSLLEIRQQILEFLGHPIIAVQGTSAALRLDLAGVSAGVIIVAHRASREERVGLIRHFRRTAGGIPIIALMGRDDFTFTDADYNCPADQPDLWIKTVQTALAGIS